MDKQEEQQYKIVTVVHKRREHYSGKYPRKYSEKYKELNPEKYKEDVAHVIAKGKTPAGMHIPIMVTEILNVLDIKPGEQGFDGTLGYGGHTQAMLAKLAGKGHLYSGDVDEIEEAKTEARLRRAGFGSDIWTPRLMNFADVDLLATEVGKFDFILADLGVSSMQIDNPERGFSYKSDGPLDLRLNSQSGITAAERLKELECDELEWLLRENSDEPYAAEIAKQIYNALHKKKKPIETTGQLHEQVAMALAKVKLPAGENRNVTMSKGQMLAAENGNGVRSKVKLKSGGNRNDSLSKIKAAFGEGENGIRTLPNAQAIDRDELIKKSSARVFQALRIDINHEFEVLYDFMEKLPAVLKTGGRAAILTFHSGEDRIVKKAFQAFYRDGIYSDIAKEVIKPSREECFNNSRAHSTKLRWAIKA